MTTKPEDIKLGYLLISTPVPNTFIGGAMVTDGRGLPVEFRYSEPIQPTKIQQILYGQVLSNYIKREVILETLLKSMESQFKCLLVTDENLLDYSAKFPIIRVSETKSPPLGEVGDTSEVGPDEVLLQTSKESSPVRLNLQNTGSGDSGSTYSVLTEVGTFMDVYEPIKRIEKALEAICQEAGISQASPVAS